MKTCLLLITLSLPGIFANAQQQPASANNAFKSIPTGWKGNNPGKADDANWLSQAQSFIQKREYFLKKVSASAFACANSTQKVVYTIHSKGYTVEPVRYANTAVNAKTWKAGFEMVAVGKGNDLFYPSAKPATDVKENYMVQHHEHFNIEYLNNAAGLRQNFIIEQQPQGKNDLKISLALKNSLLSARLVNNQLIVLTGKDGKTVLQYDELKVWDARNTPLPAHMEMTKNNTLQIIVDDKNAVYPVTVDPLNHSAEWSGSALGILPSVLGQLSVDAAYGYAVAGVGDINGDGYDDVAIGAPGLADVITGTGHLSAVGAVFVYYGSASGLPATPSAELQPSTAVTGALFGFSIAGGDINADGKNDIVVGAPLDKVSVSFGFGNTASGTVGKVYVFSGANLHGAATTPLLTLQLNGSGILEHGINLTVNALFGYSVAVTDDLNGDGKNDIIVGAPAYAGIKTLFGIHLLDAKSGGAFLFLTNNSNGFTMQSLVPPSTSLLGLSILSANVKGLLFGISVDGAGDYNGDGKPDVVVGAPAGIDLGSISGLLTGQLLQGSALVFYGNGSGTASHPGATLVASSGGLLTNITGTLSNIANLFGYCVKGVRNTSGVRTGNILVGAPLGGTLTNLLGGLQVKTGTVSVFVKQGPTASGIITPNQQLSSPRNSNTILNVIQSSLLFGFSIDNVYDVNCDGIPDIIVGEPASSGVKLIGANVAGGSAYVYLGKSNGTYQATPAWSLGATYDATLGVNAASLIGYSVAGAHKVQGVTGNNKILVGAPGRSLDFGTGLLNLGNTLGTLFGLVAGDNGVGKGYLFDTQLCTPIPLPLIITDFNAKAQNNSSVLVTWRVSTERNVNAYTIERSTNGSSWDVFGILPASPNTDTAVSFAVTDNHPHSGTSYYRIKQDDRDDGTFYTEIRTVNMGTINGVLRINNPFYSFVSIQLNASQENTASVDLLDIAGKTIRHQVSRVSAGLNTIQINDLSALPQGIYVVRILNGNDQYSWKLVKQ